MVVGADPKRVGGSAAVCPVSATATQAAADTMIEVEWRTPKPGDSYLSICDGHEMHAGQFDDFYGSGRWVIVSDETQEEDNA